MIFEVFNICMFSTEHNSLFTNTTNDCHFCYAGRPYNSYIRKVWWGVGNKCKQSSDTLSIKTTVMDGQISTSTLPSLLTSNGSLRAWPRPPLSLLIIITHVQTPPSSWVLIPPGTHPSTCTSSQPASKMADNEGLETSKAKFLSLEDMSHNLPKPQKGLNKYLLLPLLPVWIGTGAARTTNVKTASCQLF